MGGLGYLRTQEQGQATSVLSPPPPWAPWPGSGLASLYPSSRGGTGQGSRSGLGGALCPHNVRWLRGGSGQQRFCEDGNWKGQSDGEGLGRGFRVSRPPHPGLPGYSWWALLLTPSPAGIPSAGFGLWGRKRPSGTWLSPLGPIDQDSSCQHLVWVQLQQVAWGTWPVLLPPWSAGERRLRKAGGGGGSVSGELREHCRHCNRRGARGRESPSEGG